MYVSRSAQLVSGESRKVESRDLYGAENSHSSKDASAGHGVSYRDAFFLEVSPSGLAGVFAIHINRFPQCDS